MCIYRIIILILLQSKILNYAENYGLKTVLFPSPL